MRARIRRQADLVLDGRFTVEFQASPMSALELKQRTIDYGAVIDRPVLWVWDSARLKFDDEDPPEYEARMPAQIRLCHRTAFGRVYVLTPSGSLWACHLVSAPERWGYAPELGMEIGRTPKTMKSITLVKSALRPTVVFNREAGLSLTSLGEPIWWNPMRRR